MHTYARFQFILLLMILYSAQAVAQPKAVKKIAAGCSVASLKKNLYHLADAAMEGWGTGTAGDTPFIRIDCGFAEDYHKITDTPDKINFPLLKRQTELAFLTLYNIASR
jgi:hypothetical protein